jgi:oxygen-dependent protoporphyrinogen oxidase
MSRTIAIVGGGVSGLAAAETVVRSSEAAGAPIRPIVLEADSSPGGKIKSARHEGFVVETGPHGFLDKEPAVFELIDRLGIRASLIRANDAAERRFIVRAGRLRELPGSPAKFLVSDILPFMARMRVLGEPFSRSRPDREESIWEFAARRIGPGAADILVDAMVTGIFGGDPKKLSLASAFPRMFELESQYGSLVRAQLAIAKEKKRAGAKAGTAGAPTGTLHSFKEGLGEIVGALASRVEVRTGFSASRIRVDGQSFVIEGSGEPVSADAVILTVPADTVRTLLAEHSESNAEEIGKIPYAAVSVVVQCFKPEDLEISSGFGFLAPHCESRKIMGTIFASSVFPAHAPEGTVMLRTMLGGARAPELAEGDDETLFSRARAELSALIGLNAAATPIFQRAIRWPSAIPQYTLGHASRVAAADAIEKQIPGLYMAGNAFRGIAMIASIADAQKVAQRSVEHLSREVVDWKGKTGTNP